MVKDDSRSVKVWDLFVRVFHWALVVSVIIMYLTGDDFKRVHAGVGYFLICLILARILWGFVGSKHARFTDFVYGPGAVIDYLKGLLKGSPRHYHGHNPAGGLMIIVMLATLLITAFTGLKALGSEGKGPLANQPIPIVRVAYADGAEARENHREHDKGRGEKGQKDEFWEDIHEGMTGFLIFLIIVHLGGVVVSSWVHKENLILGMITGKKLK